MPLSRIEWKGFQVNKSPKNVRYKRVVIGNGILPSITPFAFTMRHFIKFEKTGIQKMRPLLKLPFAFIGITTGTRT
jgi:hypothetical protein